jgi:hypothetical protein
MLFLAIIGIVYAQDKPYESVVDIVKPGTTSAYWKVSSYIDPVTKSNITYLSVDTNWNVIVEGDYLIVGKILICLTNGMVSIPKDVNIDDASSNFWIRVMATYPVGKKP